MRLLVLVALLLPLECVIRSVRGGTSSHFLCSSLLPLRANTGLPVRRARGRPVRGHPREFATDTLCAASVEGSRDSRTPQDLPGPRRRDVFPCWLTGLACSEAATAVENGQLSHAPPSDVAIDALLEWVREHGGTGLDNIEVRLFSKAGQQVRGLAATRDIDVEVASGSVLPKPLFSIPQDLILHAGHPSVLASPFGKEANPFERLQLFLAVEKRKLALGVQSYWTPYIRTLPTSEDFALFHPLFAKKTVLDLFAALPAAQEVLVLIRYLQLTWTDNQERWVTLARASGIEGLVFEDVLWALTIILSRGYGSDWASPVLVPINDLANAGLPANVNWRDGVVDGEPPSWRVQATRSLRKGDELLEVYQDDANDEYFKLYGFLSPNNPRSLPQKLGAAACSAVRQRSQAAVPNDNTEVVRNLRALAQEYCRA